MMLFVRRLVLMPLFAVALSLGSMWSPAKAAPDAVLWPRWEAHDQGSSAVIDHSLWAEILARHLITDADGVNRFAYGDVTEDDSRTLDRYLQQLADTAISSHNRPTQMAYWINLYNALTVRVILDHYPTASIRDIDISPGLFSDGPWGKKLLTIEGEKVALDDIEHQILRPIWKDPRIHYAVNCASIGCPNLQPVPFEPDMLDRQLDEAAIEFVNHQRAVDIVGNNVIVSSIYSWFRDDFGKSDSDVLAHLKAYLSPERAMKLESYTSIHDDVYDWRLNDPSNR